MKRYHTFHRYIKDCRHGPHVPSNIIKAICNRSNTITFDCDIRSRVDRDVIDFTLTFHDVINVYRLNARALGDARILFNC